MSDRRKKLRDRATRLKRALTNEQRRFGQIDDGAGKRYEIGPLYVNAGELKKALAFHRTGDVARANDKLLETMVQNVVERAWLEEAQRRNRAQSPANASLRIFARA